MNARGYLQGTLEAELASSGCAELGLDAGVDVAVRATSEGGWLALLGISYNRESERKDLFRKPLIDPPLRWCGVGLALAIPDFDADRTSGQAPLMVQFTDRSRPGPGSISSYHWDFGDGSTSSLPSPSHTFQNPGNYLIQLRVVGRTAQTDWAASKVITVQGPGSPPVIEAFSLRDTNRFNTAPGVTRRREVYLNATATGNPREYLASERSDFTSASWKIFDDSQTFVLSPGTGQKTVYFKARNQHGESQTRSASILYSPDSPTTLQMVTLPPGSFLMGNSGAARDQYCWCTGCDCEEPRHTVTINYSFQMGKYEVTNAQYAEVLNWAKGRGYLRNSSNQPYNGGDVYHNGQQLLVLGYDISYSGGQFVSITRNSESMANHPVKAVTWYGSVAFCNWLSEKEGRSPAYNLSTWSLINRQGGGYRLPSESEWEYACRGSASNPYRYAPFSFGDDPNLDLNSCNFSSILDNYMVWCGNDDGWSEAVGSKLPNDYGLYDMHGNIWEWCQDWWHYSYNGTGRPDDGRPWESPTSSYRVFRGGSWHNFAWYCRSASRLGDSPNVGIYDIGFRFARTP